MTDKKEWLRAGLLAAALVGLLWGFQALLFNHAPGVFNAKEEDMSYAWYVPLFSLYVLWTERAKVRASLGRPGWGGLVCALPFVLLGFLGARGLQVRFEIVAFVGLIIAIPWAFYGRRTARAVLFPALFLLFCIPLNTFLDVVTVHLRLFATSVASAALHGFGADVVRTGTMLAAADGSFAIDVAEPCSGLRSIFALMALTAGYAYFNQPTWLRRALLFACSVPLAILGNVTRILTICLVGSFASPDFATGFYHDYSGYVVFIVAIALMVAAGEVLTRICEKAGARREPQDAPPAAAEAPRAARPASLALPVLFLALFLPAMVYQAATPAVTLAAAPDIRLGDIPGYTSDALDPSESELTVLPADTRFEKRLYTAENGDWFQVSVVIGGASKSSIHRPELCLPSQGFQMTRPRTVRAGGTEWRFITLESKTAALGFAYTFFNQEGFRTASHTRRICRDVLDRSFLNRIDRWVMVTVNASRADDAYLLFIADSLKDLLP